MLSASGYGNSPTSRLSEIYRQYHESLKVSLNDYRESIRQNIALLNQHYDSCIGSRLHSFNREFRSSDFKVTSLLKWAELFFGTTEINFVAIDGSCYSEYGDRFISLYGGAYGSRGTVSLEGGRGTLIYRRWEFHRDVSMVAFVPIPPEVGPVALEENTASGASPALKEGSELEPMYITDRDIRELTTLHIRIMELAESFLAQRVAGTEGGPIVQLILLDNTLSGWLGNTSYVPGSPKGARSIIGARIEGEEIGKAEVYTALAHPVSKELDVPHASTFAPHYRLIAEAHWLGESRLSENRVSSSARGEIFHRGAKALERLELAKRENGSVVLNFDPREAWERMLRAFKSICRKLFIDKDPRALTVEGDGARRYLTSGDLRFLSGVGLRALIERAWKQPRVLVIGVVKDSSSRYFFRNYLGSLHVHRGEDPSLHERIMLSDRTILELLAEVRREPEAPWATVEFDSAFMTLHPERVEGSWAIRGYYHPRLGWYTRPPRLFLRSLAQFLLIPTKRLASHVIFIDRLAYYPWDTEDAASVNGSLPTFSIDELGEMALLNYERPPRLQYLSMYLLSVLVRNHFPEALGYPEPLHKADWGAKNMRESIKKLLKSSWLIERANPLMQPFRRIRDSLGR